MATTDAIAQRLFLSRWRCSITCRLRSRATDAIAERLFRSPWTVQDHLKAIFEKTGTGNGGELVARLFFEHHAPRLTGDALTSGC